MTRRLHSYASDDLIVRFDAKRCIHAEECVSGLPEAFDATRRPWIDPTRADAADIVQVIERCPTGALTYEWPSGEDGEAPPPGNSLRVEENGPLYLHGRLRLTLPDGDVVEENRVALCRCGHSKAKPFCDNSHGDAGFTDDGAMSESRLKPGEGDHAEALEISLATSGPILIRGPVQMVGTDGRRAEGSSGALCRCGHSATKPFCDGSHKREGFVTD